MGVWGDGLGRKRAPFGERLDAIGVSQMDLHKWSGISRPTISKLYGDKSYKASTLTKRTIIEALIRRGYNVTEKYFWD